ncbi:SURF1 family protein [Vibrio tapetis]|uniref:SURF1-like protein n=1 Tax=Vibrio tapetis subsp. tapetis TaxID=1671868 RepID=A0A2N8ZL66_9VIBR|nr:SURF1 family protein [Vibrio tapetis]SON52651.1 Cytochrome C oxidase subunit II [Vibrio tapetis subsp. tapetis]
MLTRVWFWVAFVLTVVVFSILIKLGLWQLDRSAQKSVMEQQLEERQNQAAMPLTQLSELPIDSNITGVIGVAHVEPMPDQIVLLDNQTFNGKVGYLAYQLAVVTAQLNPPLYVLLELGFVDAPLSRNELPKIAVLRNKQQVSGRMYRRETNPISHQLHAEPGWPKRIQNLNLPELAMLLEEESADLKSRASFTLMPWAMQIQNIENWPYEQPWKPVSMSADKHMGYAVQWFAMASVFLIIMLTLFLRSLRQVTLLVGSKTQAELGVSAGSVNPTGDHHE